MEVSMQGLNLKLTDAKRPLVSETRKKSGREVVLDGITHQIGLLNDQNYTVERTRYVKSEAGNTRKTVRRPPTPWFWTASDGNMLVQVRYGHATTIEIEPGKPTIVGGKTRKDVIKVLEQVAAAVKEGHLDAQVDAAKAKAKHRRTKSE
jgi:hypothetical protein